VELAVVLAGARCPEEEEPVVLRMEVYWIVPPLVINMEK